MFTTGGSKIYTNRIVMNSNSVLFQIDYFIRNSPYKKVKGSGNIGLSDNSVRSYKSLRRIWDEFENHIGGTVHFTELNKDILQQFIYWMIHLKKYSVNYQGQLLKLLKSISKEAERGGEQIHNYCNHIESYRQRKIDRIIVTLNQNEINKLKELVNLSYELENIRKWFLLGLNIGQRISDLLKITPQNLRQAPNGGMYLDLIQIKTKKSITVGIIDPTVLEFLRRDFPQRTNASVFNKKIKELCRLAGIDQVIKGNKMSSITKRVELGMYPKYELITSHTMRRSFATNYFGKIETPILMEITGHSRESTFLSYIGENPNKDAVADVFMERLRRLGSERV